MALFFFVADLEVRREFDMGELRDRRRLALPLVAGLGGTVVPIAGFLDPERRTCLGDGWAITMSTDTVFGPRHARAGRPGGARAPPDIPADGVDRRRRGGSDRDRHGLPERREGGAPGRRRCPVRRDRAGREQRRTPGSVLRRAGCGRMAGAVGVRGRPRHHRAGHGLAHPRRSGGPGRPREGQRPVPAVPGAADLRAGPFGKRRPRVGHLTERPPPAPVSSVDELPGRARVRAGQRRDRREGRLPRARARPHRSPSGSWSAQ